MKANRKSVRAPVVPTEIRGILTVASSKEQTPFLVWDVAETGLGIWCSNHLHQNEVVELTVGQPYIMRMKAKVKWISASPDANGYRCGLDVIDGMKVLEALYKEFRSAMKPETTSE